MSYYVLHDSEADRALLFDSVSETAFGEAFIGADAKEQAESFLAYLLPRDNWPDWQSDILSPRTFLGHTILPDATDPRCYTQDGLKKARRCWRQDCMDGNGRLNGYGWQVYEYGLSNRDEPFPEPDALDDPSNAELSL